MPNEELNRSDPWSAVVIALTLLLFLISVFMKGFTHELLLEAGVFLVSIKLILMAQKNGRLPELRASGWSVSRVCWNRFNTSRHKGRNKPFPLQRARS